MDVDGRAVRRWNKSSRLQCRRHVKLVVGVHRNKDVPDDEQGVGYRHDVLDLRRGDGLRHGVYARLGPGNQGENLPTDPRRTSRWPYRGQIGSTDESYRLKAISTIVIDLNVKKIFPTFSYIHPFEAFESCFHRFQTPIGSRRRIIVDLVYRSRTTVA